MSASLNGCSESLGVPFVLSILIVFILSLPSSSFALPFNDDMVDSQPKTGGVMRPRPKDSVPVGRASIQIKSRADTDNLTNPKRGNERSALHGAELFRVNCSPCHGTISKTNRIMGSIEAFSFAPNLAMGFYDEDNSDGQVRTDGDIFGTIFLGKGLMSAVGWKLSQSEAWDIVTYIRSVQVEDE